MASGTETSDFGTTKRENHDSSYFYASKLYQGFGVVRSDDPDGIENRIPSNLLNKIILGDSRNLSWIPDNSIHLVVTSPPYNTRKRYDDDLSLSEYLQLIDDVFTSILPKLVDGGRIIINLANIGRKPYIPLTDKISHILTNIGYIQRGEIIWDKGASAGNSTSWGSWQNPSNPCLRDVHEYLLVFSKGTLKRSKVNKNATISKEEFLEYTKSIWHFSTTSAKKVGHPAPFPVELPYRCIQLYSYEGDVIFDPFMGSGSTALAAVKTMRNFIGLDIEPNYVKLANERVDEFCKIEKG